jgi:hypothetical protein
MKVMLIDIGKAYVIDSKLVSACVEYAEDIIMISYDSVYEFKKLCIEEPYIDEVEKPPNSQMDSLATSGDGSNTVRW